METTKSNIQTIFSLLKLKGKTNKKEILYKKTEKEFKKKYGIKLENAPLIFKKHNCLYKLSHITFVTRGRKREHASYQPCVAVKDKFDELQNDNVKTVWDNL